MYSVFAKRVLTSDYVQSGDSQANNPNNKLRDMLLDGFYLYSKSFILRFMGWTPNIYQIA